MPRSLVVGVVVVVVVVVVGGEATQDDWLTCAVLLFTRLGHFVAASTTVA